MKKAVSVLLHPEALVGIRDFGGRICASGFDIVLPAHVVLVDHHRITKREAHATVVASWTKFTVGGLSQLDMVVWHMRPSCLGGRWSGL